MNKDKMEIEEAVKICENFIKENKSRPIVLHTAIETVLQALKCKDNLIEDLKLQAKSLNGIIRNSIPKKKIKDKKVDLEKEYENKLEKNSIKAFILKCQIEILQDLLKED